MKIEFVDGVSALSTREFTTKDGADRRMHSQKAFLHIPGMPYPLPFEVSIETPNEAYSPGFYEFGPECIRTNNYGALEFNRFGMKFNRISKAS